MFLLHLVGNLLASFPDELIAIPIVGRFSLKCPHGIEAFGVTSIVAISNFCATISGLLGARLLYATGIRNGDYSRISLPTTMVLGYSFLVFLASFIIGN